MRAQFDFTFEELVEVTYQSSKRMPEVLKARIQNTTIFSLLTMLLVYIAVSGSPTRKFLFGLGSGIGMGLYLCFTFAGGYKKRLAKMLAREVSSTGPFRCVVSLEDHGLVVSQMETITTRQWKNIESVKETPEGIEIISRSSVILVRSRAFA